jgi:hypothetical protein
MSSVVLKRRWLLASAIAAGAVALLYSQSQVQVGYAIITANAGVPAPVASALFTYSNTAGVIVSQAGVASAPPFLRSRLFVDEKGTKTGVALVNTSAQIANVNMVLRDSSGGSTSQSSLSLKAGEHTSRYVQELFGTLPSGFTGSLTFESNQPLSSITLREGRNAFNEPLYTTFPVVDLNASSDSQLIFPHLAAGEGYRTQLVLINRGPETSSGPVRFVASNGTPLSLRVNGTTLSDLSYTIQPDGVYQVELESPSGLSVGYAVLNPVTGSAAPAGTVNFRFVANGTVVTEAAVAASRPTTVGRIFVDYLGSQTGVAFANAGPQAADVTLTLMDRYGTVDSTTTLTLPAGQQLARFVHEFFPNVGDGFSGQMEIRSSISVVPVTLKLVANTRGELVLTTLPVADLTIPPVMTPVVLPQIATGSGFFNAADLSASGFDG